MLARFRPGTQREGQSNLKNKLRNINNEDRYITIGKIYYLQLLSINLNVRKSITKVRFDQERRCSTYYVVKFIYI